MQLRRRRLLQLAGAMALGSLARPARADTYPSRVVKILVGFPPGGGADLATRIVAGGLSDIWHQQMVVENRPGAGARIALDAVAHAAADGYTILLAPGSPLVQPLLFSKLTLTRRPISPRCPWWAPIEITQLCRTPRRSKPFRNSSPTPRPIQARSAGPRPASAQFRIAGELFKHMAGIEIGSRAVSRRNRWIDE